MPNKPYQPENKSQQSAIEPKKDANHPTSQNASSDAAKQQQDKTNQGTAENATTSPEVNIFSLTENSGKTFSANQKPIIELFDDIRLTEKQLDIALKDLIVLKDKSKSIKRVEQRLGKKHSIHAEERRMLKLQRKHLEKDIVNLREMLDLKRRQYRDLYKRETANLEKAILQSKADSKLYIEQGKSVILGKARNLINDVIKNGKKDDIINLQTLGQDISDDGKRTFDTSLRELFYNEDVETYILCGGAIKKRLHEAIRKSLLNWKSDSESVIPELEITQNDESKKDSQDETASPETVQNQETN